MDERTCDHPLAYARTARGMTRVDLAQQIRTAAQRRGLRCGVDKQRIRKWEVDGVTPDRDSQTYIAEAFGIPVSVVDTGIWPQWLHGTSAGVTPLGPHSTVPALREALSSWIAASSFPFPAPHSPPSRPVGPPATPGP